MAGSISLGILLLQECLADYFSQGGEQMQDAKEMLPLCHDTNTVRGP